VAATTVTILRSRVPHTLCPITVIVDIDAAVGYLVLIPLAKLRSRALSLYCYGRCKNQLDAVGILKLDDCYS
jgi:hypothetical protein